MPIGKDIVYDGGKIPEVAITAADLKKQRLLQISGEYYYNHIDAYRKALQYMRSVGDRDGERKIAWLRLDYGRALWAKGTFMLMGGIVASVFAAGYVASAIVASPMTLASAGKLCGFAKSNSITGGLSLKTWATITGTKMVLNAGTQALFDKEHFRGINYVTVAAEVLPFNVGGMVVTALSATVELRPFSKEKDRQLRLTFYNKSVSKTVYDMFSQTIIGGISGGSVRVMQPYLKKVSPLAKKIIKNMLFPSNYAVYQLEMQKLSLEIGEKYDFKEDENK
jgi:hypothetical protein